MTPTDALALALANVPAIALDPEPACLHDGYGELLADLVLAFRARLQAVSVFPDGAAGDAELAALTGAFFDHLLATAPPPPPWDGSAIA